MEHPSRSPSQPLARRKFHFVTGSRDGGGLPAEAKAHIASESNRQKRLREVQAFQVSVRRPSQEVSKSSEVSPKTRKVKGCAEGEGPRTVKSDSLPLTSTSGISPRSVIAHAVVGSTPRKRARVREATPPSPLGLVERNLIDMDPFETMPAKMNHSAKYLVGLISPMFMETSFCSAQWGEMFINSFGLSLWYNNPCKLYNMLESISAFVDLQRGRNLSQETMRWRSAGIRALNTLIADPRTRYSDQVFMAISGLMHSQTVYDSDARLQMPVHSRGMAQVLKHRGGIEYMGRQLPPSIEGYVSVVSITSSKAQIAHLDDMVLDPAGLAEIEDWKLDVNYVAEVLAELSQWRKVIWLGQNDFSHDFCQEVLKQLVDPIKVPLNDVEESHHLFILVFLGLTRWTLRDKRDIWFECVRELESLTRNLGKFSSLPNISWLLMDNTNQRSRRKWQALRILKALHRLPTQQRIRVKQLFFALVTGNTLASTLTSGGIVALRDDFMAGLPRARRFSLLPGD